MWATTCCSGQSRETSLRHVTSEMALKGWLEVHRGRRRRTICQTETTHKNIDGQESNIYRENQKGWCNSFGAWEV